jgi:16S rRNA (cytidine1402-2'-O)-methyltransferase
MTKSLNPALYLVGTPIGNLEDITFRALRILQSAHLIAAEDTRHTGKLLQHYQITTPQVSYHQHNHHQRLPELLEHLHSGQSLALVSDAGMPSISDPGYELVKACIEAEIGIVPIPGVTALITALAASGLPTNSFSFEGFLPTKTKARNAYLESLKNETRTLIFYESPHRLRQTLADFSTVVGGERQIVLGRELTKIHEEFWRGTIDAAITLYREKRQPKGEYTLVVAGEEKSSKIVLSEAEIKVELQQLLAQGMTRSQASRHLSQLTSLPRRQIYEISLD